MSESVVFCHCGTWHCTPYLLIALLLYSIDQECASVDAERPFKGMVFFVHLCPSKHLDVTADSIKQALCQKGASISLFFCRDVTHLLTNVSVLQKEEDLKFPKGLPRNTRSMSMIKMSHRKIETQNIIIM
jgi:hypothetical protein